LGRSRGGLSTKIHAAADALGNPARLVAGPGQQGEVLRGAELIEGMAPGSVLADTAYDAEHFHEAIVHAGARACIKPRPNRKTLRPFDSVLYKERNHIERFFNKLKHFRRVATRYDKLVANFMGFVILAAIAITLR
jgi:putative transposase